MSVTGYTLMVPRWKRVLDAPLLAWRLWRLGLSARMAVDFARLTTMTLAQLAEFASTPERGLPLHAPRKAPR